MFGIIKKLIFIILICLFFGVFIYYHRIPLPTSFFYLQTFFRYWSWNFILHHLAAFFLLAILILTAAGIGHKILKLFKLNFYSVLVEFIFSLSLGLGFFSLVTLLLGFLALFFSPVFYLLLLGSFLVLYPEIKYFASKTSSAFWVGRFEARQIVFGICLGIIILAGLILNIGGPAIQFDELVYHLAIPDIYLKNNRILNIPYLIFSNYPLNVEMLFTLAMGLESDTLAQLVHFSFGLLAGLSIYLLSKTYFGRRQGLLSMLIFFSLPSIIFTMSFAFNDLALTYYVILAVYAMLNWIKINERRWLILSGALTGLAMGVKYSGIICFIILFGFIIMNKTPIKSLLKELAIFSLAALLPMLPWLIKNFILIGNPIYPFLYEIFGGENWDNFNSQWFTQEMSHYGPQQSGILRYLVLPFFLTCDWQTGDIPIGPLLLFYLPFLFFIKNVDKNIKYLLIFCGAYFFCWVITSMVIRFLFPCLALLCVVAGYVVKEIRKSLFFEIPVVIALILNIYTLYTAIGQHPDFYLGNKTREDKLLLARPVKDYYKVIKFINERLSTDSKILFIGEPRRYYCQKEILTSSELDTAIISKLVKESKDIKDLFSQLKKLKVTHILYNKHHIGWLKKQFNYFNWENKDQERLYDFFLTSLTLIYGEGDVYLYKIPEKRKKDKIGNDLLYFS